MRKSLLFLLLISAVLIVANSGGPGAVTGLDRTGSPLASGDCSNCHIGGDYGTEVTARLLLDKAEVQEYIPGQSYTFQLSITTTSSAERYGFQAVGLLEEANENAGTFGTAPQGTQLTNLNGRTYFEHATKLQIDSFEIEWIAPEAGTGTVQFYAAGNAVNNAGGSGGDDSDILDKALSITEGVTSDLQTIQQLELGWRVFPNPAQDQVWIELETPLPSNLQIRLLDTRGIVLQQQAVDPASSRITLSLKDLTRGLYFLQLYHEQGVATRRVFKLN